MHDFSNTNIKVYDFPNSPTNKSNNLSSSNNTSKNSNISNSTLKKISNNKNNKDDKVYTVYTTVPIKERKATRRNLQLVYIPFSLCKLYKPEVFQTQR